MIRVLSRPEPARVRVCRTALAVMAVVAVVALALTALAPTPASAQPREARGAVQLIAGDLNGQTLWVDAAVANLQALGFNDSASQIEIRQGRWELCSDGGFGGDCQVFGPGRHTLPPALRNRLSSLRPTHAVLTDALRPAPGDARAAIVLYEHPDFSGRELALSDAERNLGARNFNDMLSAVEIRRGRWELCRHADFGGDCIVLGPGRHTLERRLQDEISSLRPQEGRGWSGGGWSDGRGPRDERPDWRGDARRSVVLHEAEGRQGRSLRVDDAVANLRELDFNDRAAWIDVQDGRWELCADARFGAPCQTYGPGRHRLPPALAGRVSSLRPR